MSIIDDYKNGLKGAPIDERERDEFLSSIPMPLYGDYSNDIKDSGVGKIALPYKHVLVFDKEFGVYEPQEAPDCTSHGTRNAGMVTVCSDIIQKKQPEIFKGRIATEPIYGHRGHSGAGMNPTRAARFVSTVSGLHIRKDYGVVNLSRYNAQIGIRWGARGVPQNIIDLGKESHIETVSLVKTTGEARDLLYNGYGLTIASSFGFSNRRDKNGISVRSGSWNHQMSIIAMDDTKQRHSELLFLIQNSWGRWNSGPKFPEDQPDGSFWVTATILHGMIRDGECWVFSGAKGFPSKNLDWSLYEKFL